VDAQYVIDIAASMTGGQQTAAELDTLTADLMGAGRGAEFFQEAIKTVSGQLDVAKASAVAANDALAAGNVRFGELEKAALKAAQAAEKAALKNDGIIPHELAERVASTSAQLEHYGDTLKILEADAKAADDAEKQLGNTLKNLKTVSGHVDKSIAGQAESTEKLRGALSMVPGPVGKLGASLLGPIQGFQKLSGEMGTSNAAALLAGVGFAGLIVVLAALVVGLGVAVLGVAKWAVGLGDARRETELTAQAAAVLDPTLGTLSDTFAAVSAETGASAEDMRAWRKQLEGAKVSAEDMPEALRAVALAEGALGKGQGVGAFTEQLKEAKGAVGDVAGEFEAFAPIVQQKLKGLDAQGARFKKNISDLFGGLNIEPALEGLETLVSLFDKNTAAGQTIKFLFEEVFQPLIDQAQRAAWVVEAFGLGFLIGLTKIYIAVKPVFRAISELFGFDDSSLTDTLDMAKLAGELIAPVFLVIVAVFGAVAAAVVFLVAQLMLFPAVAAAVVAAFVWLGVKAYEILTSAFDSVKDFLNGLIPGFGDLGADIVQGMINGILSGAAGVVGAVVNVAKGAITAAKSALGIKSPSTVFAGIGDNTVAGFVNAVDDGASDAEQAMADMVTPPDYSSPLAQQAAFSGSGAAPAAEAGSGSSTGGAGAAGPQVNFNAPVYFGGKQASKGEVSQLADLLTQVLRGDATTLGAELAPA